MPSHSLSRNKESDEVNALNGSMKKKQECRRQQRNQARDQNRPNLNISSPEYEVLSSSSETDKFSDDDEEVAATARRSLNDSFAQIKQREKWQQEQKLARRKNFAKNRRSVSESSQLHQPKLRDSSELLQSLDESFKYQSCTSLSSESKSEMFVTPKKGIAKNFFMSHHSELNRMSDIYVPSKTSLTTQHNNLIVHDVTWLDIKSFLLGFIIAFATVFKSFFSKKK